MNAGGTCLSLWQFISKHFQTIGSSSDLRLYPHPTPLSKETVTLVSKVCKFILRLSYNNGYQQALQSGLSKKPLTKWQELETVMTSYSSKGEHIYFMPRYCRSISIKFIYRTNAVVIRLVTHSKAGVILCRFCTILKFLYLESEVISFYTWNTFISRNFKIWHIMKMTILFHRHSITL